MIIEYRDQKKLKQISYIFLSEVYGDPGEVRFMDDEVEDGFKLVWVQIDKIDNVIDNDSPTDYEGQFIHLRDKYIINFYRKRLNEQ